MLSRKSGGFARVLSIIKGFMKTALLTSLLLAVPIVCTALEGIVVLSSGEPVHDALVTVLGYTGTARTDAEGNFIWAPDPTLPFEVLVVLPGGQYMAPVLVERIPTDGPLVITVRPLVIESVTVSSGAAPHIEAPPAAAATLLPEEDIVERQPARLTQVLARVPGAGSVSDLHAAVPSLRGLARGRTLLLIDGARVTTERRAGPSATYLDPVFLQAVEVTRGPGSVAYGSDAFGGVINAVTKKPEPGTPLRARVRGAFGAGLPEKTVGVEVSDGFEGGGVIFQARYRDFDAYRSPDGEIFNSQASDRGFFGRFVHEVGQGEFSVGWQTDQGRDIGRPDNRGMERVTTYPREDSNRFTTSYDMDPWWGFSRVLFEGFLGSYRLLTERVETGIPDEPARFTASDVSARDFGFRGKLVKPVGRARIDLGVDVNGRIGLEALDALELRDDAGEPIEESEQLAIEDARRIDSAVYASTEALVGSRFTAGGGLRFDHVTTRNQGGFFGDLGTSNDAVSGYASLKADLGGGYQLTGQFAHGFRDPTLSDRYFFGISARGIVIGNPELEPERANQFDVAFRSVKGNLRWAVYAYSYHFDSLIERFETMEDVFTFRNRGEAVIRGVELELQSRLGERTTIDLNTQISRGQTTDDHEPLDDIPAPNLKVDIRNDFSEKLYGEFRIALFAENNRQGPTEIVTPSYVVLDLGAGWRVGETLELRGTVRNLLDKAYPISPDRRAVLAPGINAVVTVVAEF